MSAYLHGQVQAGLYSSEDDVIRDALERHRQSRQLATTTSQAELTPEEVADQETQRRLLAAGVISEIKPPPRLLPHRDRFSPVSVTGEPISETIIRERR